MKKTREKRGVGMANAPPEKQIMSAERAEIITWLKSVKFRPRIFGGVDERTVWKRIGELDTLYAKALEAERLRYETLLEEYKKAASRKISALQEQYRRGGDPGG